MNTDQWLFSSYRFLVLVVVASLSWAGCDSNDGNDSLDGGTLEVLLTDAPGDLAEAIVTIDRVELVPQSGAPFILTDDDQELDLLTLQDGTTASLARKRVPAETYTQIRLVIREQARIQLRDGTRQTLQLPSGEQTGRRVTLPPVALGDPDDRASIVLDFDVQDSFRHVGPGTQYRFQPTIRIRSMFRNGEPRPVVGVEGIITSVNGSQITVEDVSFAITSRTELGDDLALGDLSVGDAVDVEGLRTTAGLEALEIDRQDPDDEVERSLEAPLEAVDNASVTLLGQTIAVTAETEFDDPLNDLDDLRIGQRVEVDYTIVNDTKTATEIERQFDQLQFRNRAEVQGAITGRTGNALTVEDVTFEVSDLTRFEGVNGLTNLSEGDVVEVDAVITEAGDREARRVERTDDDTRYYEGALEAVTEASVTLLGQTVQVVSSTEFSDGVSGIADLRTGDRVEVEFQRMGEQKIATKIEPEHDEDVDD